MKNIKFFKTLSALLFIAFIFTMTTWVLSGCNKGGTEPTTNDNQTLTTVDFDYIQYGCVCSFAKMQRDSVYMINSEEEFENFYTCGSDPQIDFSTKTLLIAFGSTTYGISNITSQLTVENNIYTLMVDVTLNMAAVAQGWHISVIVDKINISSVLLNLNKHF